MHKTIKKNFEVAPRIEDLRQNMSKQISESESNDTCKDTKTNDLVSQAFGQNITEDILEKWIMESDINEDGKVNYNSFLHKIKHQKKKSAENYLFKEM